MTTEEKIKKLQTLPWYALHDIAIKKGLNGKEVNGNEKTAIIHTILSNGLLIDDEIDQYVNDYIYGDRVTFTLWTFQSALEDCNYEMLRSLENCEDDISVSGYRNLKIQSVNEYDDRMEILYVYSKEYTYINEDGLNANVWEQHRGCLWIGKSATYLACISKHEKMTIYMTKYIARLLKVHVVQIKPPKSAIDKCTNAKAVSRIVLQGKGGEKTIVSRAGGITDEQEEEIERIRHERIDTSGSVISAITDEIDATIKYNSKNGSIGIYKHLPASILFDWSENAIRIIMEEIEQLKGKPAEVIFGEVGQEIKWINASIAETTQLNWFLSQVIAALDKEGLEMQIPIDKLGVLDNDKWFIKTPRIYCMTCDSYEIPYCSECGKELRVKGNEIEWCECGAPRKIRCSEGHNTCEIVNWYVPTHVLTEMINKNIKKIFKDYTLEYSLCVLGEMIYIENGVDRVQRGVEIPFTDIECFKSASGTVSEEIKAFAVNMNEKCGKTCSYEKIEKCLKNDEMVCLPKVFYSILPGFRLQPHKGTEYSDVSGEVRVGNRGFEFKGIIKKNSENRKGIKTENKVLKPLLSSSKEGQEIIRQFIEQGISDARCQIIAVIIPQYIDAGLKGTLRHLAKLAGKNVTFIELDGLCSLIPVNGLIKVV